MTDKPWYAEGLRFECSECGNCCTGAPGYVWLNQDEIQKMAETVEMAVEEFEQTYVRKVGMRKSLKEHSNGDCVFFDNKTRHCQVYSARPRQCKTWPFWDSNLKTEQEWKETCDFCPGSGTGPLYDIETIEQRRREIRI
ncbi:MAG: hypothetical protein COA78_27155 [Blastopirellula sp.]|nr:MAG: hypothetical protein COA78_27155 [Blastopirellula sp.]